LPVIVGRPGDQSKRDWAVLITPVVRNAETKPLSAISNEMKDLAAWARKRKAEDQEARPRNGVRP
jgi:pyruvate/2-oxoglutarate dehydrogenase complex dihydrolipoamide acyltransferase (E2) component